MMPRVTPLSLVVAVMACAGTGTGELPVPEEPPQLPGGADNPSAWDYFRYGESIFEDSPGTAAEAFYWASRRDPVWATPMFARRLAVFLDHSYLFERYLSGNRSALRDPLVQKLDSLYLRALKLNPLLDRRLDGRALKQLWRQSLRMELQFAYRGRRITDMDVTRAVERFSDEASPEFRGLLAHSEGRYNDAAELYAEALAHDSTNASLHSDQARVLFMLGRHEDAIEHMRSAVAELRVRDEDELQRIYNSKALYLHGIGLIEEARGSRDAARQVYAEALQEDLSYYPAHVRLAAEIAPGEAAVLMSYGRLLAATDQLEEAESVFRHLTEIEPLFASPLVRLGSVLEAQGRSAEALAAFRAFVDRAANDDDGLEEANARITELEKTVTAEGSERTGGP